MNVYQIIQYQIAKKRKRIRWVILREWLLNWFWSFTSIIICLNNEPISWHIPFPGLTNRLGRIKFLTHQHVLIKSSWKSYPIIICSILNRSLKIANFLCRRHSFTMTTIHTNKQKSREDKTKTKTKHYIYIYIYIYIYKS